MQAKVAFTSGQVVASVHGLERAESRFTYPVVSGAAFVTFLANNPYAIAYADGTHVRFGSEYAACDAALRRKLIVEYEPTGEVYTEEKMRRVVGEYRPPKRMEFPHWTPNSGSGVTRT